MTYIKRIAVAALAATTMAASIASTSVPARAEHGHHGAAAAGILGGIAAGALAAGALSQEPAYPSYGYPPPPDGCGFTRVPVYDAYGNFAGYRRVPAC